MVGKTISHYKIIEKLGEGGMGVVYKAEDTKLKRTVALKFLSSELTRDPEAKTRFVQEAQAASGLDHSNICTIYEINQTEEEQIYISMAYYSGETLRDRIAKGPLAIDEAVDIAGQIADGLSKAHQKGIVHRDVKPANLFITEDGEVKILDFGLAKLAGQARLTRTGTTIGTVAYMSPEQARGEDVDASTDIWSLGVVFYEMLAGRLPFTGDHEQAVIYSIVNHEPAPIGRYREKVPGGLQQILTTAMQKERNSRYRNLADFRSGLERALQPSRNYTRGVRAQTKKLIPYIAVSVAVVLVLVSLTKFFRPHTTQYQPPIRKQVTFNGKIRYPVLSPDGNYVAWSVRNDEFSFGLWVKDLTAGAEINIFSAPRCWTGCWSPDGSRLIFSAVYGDTSGGTYLISRLGGEPRKIIDSPWPYVAWAPDGSRIAYLPVDTKEINILDLDSGEIRTLHLEKEIGDVAYLDWSAGRDKLLFQADDKECQAILTINPDGSDQKQLLKTRYDPNGLICYPRWSPKGNAIYFFKMVIKGQATFDLLKLPFDPGSGEATGDPELVCSGLRAGDRGYSLSRDGTKLLYEQQTQHSNLWVAAVEGDADSHDVKAKQLTTGTAWKSRAEISPDGSQVVFSMSTGEAMNVYTMKLPKMMDGFETIQSPRQLTFFNSTCDVPVWSPDGREIAFSSSQGGVPRIWHMNSGGGTPEPFENTTFELWTGDHIAWAPGRNIMYRSMGVRNFKILDPVSGEQSSLVDADSLGYIFYPVWSPGGDKIAFFWNRDRAIPPSMGTWIKDMRDGSLCKIAEGVVDPIAWTADGAWVWGLRYDHRIGELATVFKIPVTGGKPVPWIDLPFEKLNSERLSMTPDGRTFVYSEVERQADAWIITNFDPHAE